MRSDRSNKDVPLINLGADTDHTVFVQVLGSFLTYVRNIRSKFFFAAFGIPDFQFKLLNVERSKDIFPHDPLGNHNRVLEFEAMPGHEGNLEVPAKGKFPFLVGLPLAPTLSLGHTL